MFGTDCLGLVFLIVGCFKISWLEIHLGHPNCITGSKVTAILQNWWILPIGGASSMKGLRLQPAQRSRLVLS